MDREKVIKDNAIFDLQSAIEISGALVHLRKEYAKAILELLKEQEEEIENLKQTAQSMMEGICLLKEQEAVEPKTEPSAKGYWYTCGVCGWWLFEVRDTVHFDDRKRIHFCASCGRSVKWE